MGQRTKLKLSNDKFTQQGDDTLTLSGNTHILGNLLINNQATLPFTTQDKINMDDTTIDSETITIVSSGITFTKSHGIATTNDNINIVSISGISGSSLVKFDVIGTGTLSFDNLENLYKSDSLVKTTGTTDSRYSIIIHNVGTTENPSYQIKNFYDIGGETQNIEQLATAFNTTNIENEKILYSNLKGLPILSGETITISDVIENSRILTLNSSPFILKSSSGLDIIDNVTEVWGYLLFNTVQYTGGTNLLIKSGNSILGNSDILEKTTTGWYKFNITGKSEANSEITITVATEDPVSGNSHIGIIAEYKQYNPSIFTFPSYITVPDAPVISTDLLNGDIVVNITPPIFNGNSSITGYRIEYRINEGTWSDWISSTLINPYTMDILEDGEYDVRVYAINEIGESLPSNIDSETVISASITNIIGINFKNSTLDNVSGWNNYQNIGTTTTGETFANLISIIDGQPTNIGFTQIVGFYGATLSNNALVGDDSSFGGEFPDLTIKRALISRGVDPRPMQKFTGLDLNTQYNLKIAWSYDDTSFTTYDAQLTVDISGSTVSSETVDGRLNITTLAESNLLYPNENGEIIIEYKPFTGGLAVYGVNALKLEIY